MNTNDIEEFTEVWNATCEGCRGKAPSDTAVSMIFASLQRFELSDIKSALIAHMQHPDTGRFTPTVADITRQLVGDPEDRAFRAWSKLFEAIERVGTYRTVVFDDPAVMATVRDMGGWIRFGEMTEREAPFTKNEFVKRYRGYCERPPATFPAKLVGIADRENAGRMIRHECEPLLIGDAAKAKLVYESGDDGGGRQQVKTLASLMQGVLENAAP